MDSQRPNLTTPLRQTSLLPGSSPFSLPSRKRSGSITGLPLPKSQRTTPDRKLKPLELSSSHSLGSSWSIGTRDEPIDLTEYPTDEEADGGWVARNTSSGQRKIKSELGATPQTPTGQSSNRKSNGLSFLKKETTPASNSKAKPHVTNATMPGSWDSEWQSSSSLGNQPGPSSQIRPASSLLGPQRLKKETKNDSLTQIINSTQAAIHDDSFLYDNKFGGQNSYSRAVNALADTLFADNKKHEEDIEKLLENILPDLDESDRDLGQTPAGLKGSLYPHQIQALAWMQKLEDGTNKGGILADDMGLGKTVSTISLILARRSLMRVKTNLIVGPLSLLRQWEEELRTKVRDSHKLSVFIYHSCKATTEDLLKHDVVLTTYNTLGAEWKRLQTFQKDNAGRRLDWNSGNLSMKFPLLHPERAKFYRVILDESQFIKNMKAQAAQAAHSLKSQYRWCLSGTPMMNSVEELYSLIVFLNIKPYNSWEQFRKEFGVLFGKKGNPRAQAMRVLQALLKAVMLRRKKNSQIKGKPIVQLPEKTEEQLMVKLSKDEQDFYDQLEHRAQVLFNKYNREGTVGKHYRIMLVKLLRMRQATCHPHLNLDVDDASNDEEMESRVRRLSEDAIDRIKAEDSFECPICRDVIDIPSFIFPCGHHGCSPCITAYVENRQADALHAGEERSTESLCHLCRNPFQLTELFSLPMFYKVHAPEMLKKHEEAERKALDSDSESDEDDEDESEDMLANDADVNGNLDGFIVGDEYDDEYAKRRSIKRDPDISPSLNIAEYRRKRANIKKLKENYKWKDIKPTMLRELRAEGLKNPKARRRYFQYLKKNWQPSTKVTACLDLLREIQPTGEKTIIFSQWTLLLDLIEVAMDLDGMDTPERYDGSMSGDLRDNAIKRFREHGNARVMLVGLKAGNAGLNLTAASRVVIMDPFWNPYTEMQAIDRTYRIGQRRPVKVYRILSKDTVEGRIMELQERKKTMVESALDETASKNIARLGTNELRRLFGGA